MGNLITLHEQKLDGTPTQKKIQNFFFLVASFHSTIDHLVSKFILATSEYFLKKFQNLYDFPHSLNLNLKFRLS